MRKHTRKAAKALSVASSGESDSEHDDDSEPEISMLDTAKHTIDETGEYDETDIFSPLLPPDRRVVDSKDSGGLTLYKTAKGCWVLEAELQRFANMARNARLMKDLGVEEAMRPFTVRPTGREDDDENAPEAEDEREFTLALS